MPFLVQKWEHSIPQESGTLNPGFAQDRGSAPCPWGGVAVRTLLFCKALLLSLKPEKLCVGLAGVMDIQNSVRASKSATWKQGDELSLGMAECWPEQHLHQSSGTLCQLLLPYGTAPGFWTHCTDSCWLQKQTRLSLTAWSFCLWSPHPSSCWLSSTSRKTASKPTLFQRQN